MSLVRIFWLIAAIAATLAGAYVGYILAILPSLGRTIGQMAVPAITLPFAAVVAPFDPEAAQAMTRVPEPQPYGIADYALMIGGPALMALAVIILWVGFFRRRWRVSVFGLALGVAAPFALGGLSSLFG